MEQESNYLKSEQELRDKQDELYNKTIEGMAVIKYPQNK
ncbi:hypothetical protein SAMN04488168_107145 [Bacillus sp. 491mf]|nr:hypothetical protein SAMN04488168_107145 [Bacillus sp. 491mf]